jgi:hypothetical protein
MEARLDIGRDELAAVLSGSAGNTVDQGGLGHAGVRRHYLFPGMQPDAKRRQVLGDLAYAPLLAEMREEVEQLLEEPIADLPYSLFRLFEETGTRREYERPYFARRKRLTGLALLSWLEPDNPVYANALTETIWAVCSEYSWCLPAHLSGSAETSAVVSDSLYADEHTVAVDLFAAETAFALSEISHLLETVLPPLIRKRIADEVFRRVLRPFVAQRERPFHWETLKNNWAAVCAGSIGAAAIYMLDGDDRAEELADVLVHVLPALDSFLQGYGNDGVCTEGYSYWQYGFGYYVYFADLLRQRTGGGLDLFASDKVRAIAKFQQNCFLDGRKVVNFSDSGAEEGLFLGLAHYLKAQFPDVAAPESALRDGYAVDHCGRWASGARNLFWFRPEEEPGQPWPLGSTYLSDAQWLVSRVGYRDEEGGRRRYAFAAKGGYNDEPHNHNDLGQFILYADGFAFLADLGRGLYTRDYFREGRYEIACNGSQGHSVPIVNGLFQRQGAEYRAKVLAAEVAEEADRFALDLAGAYDCSELERLERTFIWKKTGVPELLLEDVYHFTVPPQSVVERFITLTPPDLSGEGVVTLESPAAGGEAASVRRLHVLFDADELQPSVLPLQHLDLFGQPVACYALDFKLLKTAVQMQAAFAFKFE